MSDDRTYRTNQPGAFIRYNPPATKPSPPPKRIECQNCGGPTHVFKCEWCGGVPC
jgi:hypothetical protein